MSLFLFGVLALSGAIIGSSTEMPVWPTIDPRNTWADWASGCTFDEVVTLKVHLPAGTPAIREFTTFDDDSGTESATDKLVLADTVRVPMTANGVNVVIYLAEIEIYLEDELRAVCAGVSSNWLDEATCLKSLFAQLRVFVLDKCPPMSFAPKLVPQRCPSPPEQRNGVLIYSRAYYEHAFMAGFVDWYTALGVSCFIILHADGVPLPELPPSVLVSAVPNLGDPAISHYDYLVFSQFPEYQWVISVDLDEYLLLGAAFTDGITGYIRYVSANSGFQVDTFLLNIAAMIDLSPVCTDDSLENLMERASIVDWHNYKAMTRISAMVSAAAVNPHFPLLKSGKRRIAFGGEVRTVDNGLKWSIQDFNNPLPETRNKYADHALVHFSIRSLANIVPEVLAPNGINYLELEDKGSLRNLFNSDNTSSEGRLVQEFISACGEKLSRAYIQAILFGSKRVSLTHLKAPPGTSKSVCSPALDWGIAQNILHAEGVNASSFQQFSARLATEFKKLSKGAVLSSD